MASGRNGLRCWRTLPCLDRVGKGSPPIPHTGYGGSLFLCLRRPPALRIPMGPPALQPDPPGPIHTPHTRARVSARAGKVGLYGSFQRGVWGYGEYGKRQKSEHPRGSGGKIGGSRSALSIKQYLGSWTGARSMVYWRSEEVEWINSGNSSGVERVVRKYGASLCR